MRSPDHAPTEATVTDLNTRRGLTPPPRRATYTIHEVAELLGICRASVYVRLGTGEIPARRIGKRWIIARTRFDAWLTEPDDISPTGTETWR